MCVCVCVGGVVSEIFWAVSFFVCVCVCVYVCVCACLYVCVCNVRLQSVHISLIAHYYIGCDSRHIYMCIIYWMRT